MLRPLSIAAAVCTAALSLAPAARAGDEPFEIALGKIVTLKFDLGFKLPCKHDVIFEYTNDGVIEPAKPTASTSSTNIKFKTLKVGMTSVTATFTGQGGDCNGMAAKTLDVVVLPDQKYSEKLWKGSYKETLKLIHDDLDVAEDTFHDDLGTLMDDFESEALSSDEAMEAISELVADALCGTALDLVTDLEEFSNEGFDILAQGGFSTVPPLFLDGATDSLWNQATYHAQEDYEDLVDHVYANAFKATQKISVARGNFMVTGFVRRIVPLELPSGPTLETDPEDVPLAGARVVGGFAWNNDGIGHMRWAGTGLLTAGNVHVDLIGPTAFTALEFTPTQTAIKLDALFGKWSVSVDSPAVTGIYRCETRYDRDDHVADKTTISLPAFEVLF